MYVGGDDVLHELPPELAQQLGVLHAPTHPTTYWSTTNVGEAMPGLLTPLGWTVWGPASEKGGRGAFVAMGALSKAEGDVPTDERDRFISVCYGRVCARVDFLTEMGDRVPGTSAGAIAEQFLGVVPAGLRSSPTRRRYPLLAVRLPVAFATARRRVLAEHARVACWWPAELARTPRLPLPEARRQFVDARRCFEHAVGLQGLGMFVAVQPIYDQLLALIDRADAQHLTDALMGGGGSHAETQLVCDLWTVARRGTGLDAFIAEHGYHGPREGEISGRVWREDIAPVERLVEKYATCGDDADPALGARRRADERRAAERELLSALPCAWAGVGRAILGLARRNVPIRGIGKVTFLRALDVARASARRAGHLLAEDGRLNDPEDVFYLTADELGGTFPEELTAVVEERKQQREAYAKIELPTHWQGRPRYRVQRSAETRGLPVLRGVCGAGGLVEGRVRVVTDPSFADVEADEIIVATTTDPSWASIMFLSKALVVDIGGPLSHAAIVARELGVPCVVNTQSGTSDLRTGDLVRVNGTSGTVEVLSRAEGVSGGAS